MNFFYLISTQGFIILLICLWIVACMLYNITSIICVLLYAAATQRRILRRNDYEADHRLFEKWAKARNKLYISYSECSNNKIYDYIFVEVREATNPTQ